MKNATILAAIILSISYFAQLNTESTNADTIAKTSSRIQAAVDARNGAPIQSASIERQQSEGRL